MVRRYHLYMKLIRTFLPIISSLAAFAQSPQFEVASIRPSDTAATDRVHVGVHIDGAQLTCNYFSLKDLIRMAYAVKDYQITGPDFLASDRFDIAAKLPAGAGQDQVRDMMKALLEERFQVKLHHDKKDFPVYGLLIAKNGLKIKESPADPDAGDSKEQAKAPVNVTATGGRGGVNVNLGHGSYFTFSDNKLVAKKLTMASFAEMLARFEDRPVVDMTGLTGNYDIELTFTPEDYRAMLIRSAVVAGVSLPPEALKMMEGASGDSLLAGLEKVGLKMESRKAPLDVLVVDHALKVPTDN